MELKCLHIITSMDFLASTLACCLRAFSTDLRSPPSPSISDFQYAVCLYNRPLPFSTSLHKHTPVRQASSIDIDLNSFLPIIKKSIITIENFVLMKLHQEVVS